MNISFTFKNFEPSDHLKGYANKRFEKTAKYISDSEADLQVNLLVDKYRHKADVILNADSIHISAYEDSEDMYSTIDLVLDKLEAQLRKMREKQKNRVKKARGNKVMIEGEADSANRARAIEVIKLPELQAAGANRRGFTPSVIAVSRL